MATDTSESTQGMRANPQRAAQLLENINAVRQRVQAATHNRGGEKPVRLIAVSKLKPASDILALHQPSTLSSSSPVPEPHIHFGENYAQELTEKAALLPRTIRWHFIGALQTNKCKSLAQSVPNLWCVSSVDSLKKAERLDEGRRAVLADRQPQSQPQQAQDKQQQEGASNGERSAEAAVATGNAQEQEQEQEDDRLRIMVQINTSGEPSKSGVSPTEAADLVRRIRAQCPRLRVAGLMTIGAIARSQATTAETENEDFVVLREVRDRVMRELGLRPEQEEEERLELSMGMSADFEGAIAQGSDEVRVGTTIFGERPPKRDAKVKEEVQEEKG